MIGAREHDTRKEQKSMIGAREHDTRKEKHDRGKPCHYYTTSGANGNLF